MGTHGHGAVRRCAVQWGYRCIAVSDAGGGFRSGDFFRFFCGVREPGLRLVTGSVTRIPRRDGLPVDLAVTGPRIRPGNGRSGRG